MLDDPVLDDPVLDDPLSVDLLHCAAGDGRHDCADCGMVASSRRDFHPSALSYRADSDPAFVDHPASANPLPWPVDCDLCCRLVSSAQVSCANAGDYHRLADAARYGYDHVVVSRGHVYFANRRAAHVTAVVAFSVCRHSKTGQLAISRIHRSSCASVPVSLVG